jgi:hypothetical protein
MLKIVYILHDASIYTLVWNYGNIYFYGQNVNCKAGSSSQDKVTERDQKKLVQ